MKTAILGGGITGVTTANRLQARCEDWHLFEAAPRLGGLCRSETMDGFVADTSGGHIIFSKHREVMDFIFQHLPRTECHESQRKAAIYWRDRYVQYPFENGLADLPPQDNFECLKGYIEAYMERRAGKAEPENFESWSRWRFGAGICEKFMEPYNRKLWKVPLSELSTRWVRGRVPDAPIDDVLRSSIGIRTEGYVHQSVFWYPLAGGFETLVHAIARPLDVRRVRKSTAVRRLEKTGEKFLVNGELFDRVISTIPLHELLAVCSDVPEAVLRALKGLRFTSLATVFVAVNAPARTDRSWVYFPHPETGPFNRLTHLSNYSPRNTPPGCSSYLAEITHLGDLDNSESFQRQVAEHMASCGLFDLKDVRFTRSFDNKYAYILYTHEMEANLETVRGWLKSRGIDLIGRFGNYDYYNSDQCIRAALDFVGG